MRFLKKNTAVRISVGPFFDFADGVTPETAMTVTNISGSLTWDDDDNTAVNSSSLTITASGGSNDMVHVSGGIYDLELTAAQTNVGPCRMMLTLWDSNVCTPAFHEFQVLDANVYDSLFGSSSDFLDVNVEEIKATTVLGVGTAGDKWRA